jgi:hypothetical protein
VGLRALAWDVLVYYPRQIHLDHLPDQQHNVIYPLGDHVKLALVKLALQGAAGIAHHLKDLCFVEIFHHPYDNQRVQGHDGGKASICIKDFPQNFADDDCCRADTNRGTIVYQRIPDRAGLASERQPEPDVDRKRPGRQGERVD